MSKVSDKILNAIMGAIDRGDKIIDIFLKGGLAYAGLTAFKHPMGAVYSLLGLRLAQSPNLATGTAGVAMLTSVGVINLVDVFKQFPPVTTAQEAGAIWARTHGLKE